MLIILEGPDLAGKSTLAHKLLVYLASKNPSHTVSLLHRGPPTLHPLDEYVTPLLEYEPGRGEHIICDRWHLGELVYPQVTGRDTKMTVGVWRYIEMFLQSRGAIVVHVSAAPEEITRRFNDRGDDVRSLDEVHVARKMFFDAASNCAVTQPVMDPYVPSVDTIVATAAGAESAAINVRRLITYVGAPYPDTLYVGDMRSCLASTCPHTPRHQHLWPAFGPYRGTSGEFLMRALFGGGLEKPRGVGIVNVNDVDKIEALYHSDVARIKHTVALGRNAHRTLKQLDIPHTSVPHPQYARRFHAREIVSYRQLLRLRDQGDHIGWKTQSTPETDEAHTSTA